MKPESATRVPSNDPVVIRPARVADLPAIVAMRDALNDLERSNCQHAPIQRLSLDEFTAQWGQTLDDPGHCWRIVESAGRPIGFGLIYLLPRTRPIGAFLHWAYLDAAYRGEGLGRHLFDHLVEWARSKGSKRIELQFIEGNEGGRLFWDRMGFRPYARKCVCYLEPGDASPSSDAPA